MPGSQKISQNFHWTIPLNFLTVFDVSSLEMQGDSKNYVSVQDDEITELVHTSMRLTHNIYATSAGRDI